MVLHPELNHLGPALFGPVVDVFINLETKTVSLLLTAYTGANPATSKMGWPFWFRVQQKARQEGRGHGGMERPVLAPTLPTTHPSSWWLTGLERAVYSHRSHRYVFPF